MRCFKSSVPAIILFGAYALLKQTIAASIAKSDAPCLAGGQECLVEPVSGSSLLQTQPSSFSYGQLDTCTRAFADQQQKAVSLVAYQPHKRGGETHSDLREVLKQMQPGLAKEIVELASPLPETANLLAEAEDYEGIASTRPTQASCNVSRWVQYAMCEELATKWLPPAGTWSALSFGGNGYDEWSERMRSKFAVTPNVFDCFDPREVSGTIVHPVCIGGKAQRNAEQGQHKFEDLNALLQDKKDRSVLMKLDIEGSEFDVLHELTSASMRKVGYLTVEFHFLDQTGTRCCAFNRIKSLFHRLTEEFVVIDGAEMQWGGERDCNLEGGYVWPNAMTVSYIPKEFMKP